MDQTQSPPTAPNRIFMSYRRQETEYPAGWLFDRLTEHFRGAEVFKDIDSIEPGDDFVEVITSAVQSCDVLLALIGDRWLTMTDGEGRRRIDDPRDFVRVEIEAALSRKVRVVPILVYGAKMPRADDLPDSLASLVRRQALELSASHFEPDVTRLLKVLDKSLADVRTPQVPQVLQASQDDESAMSQREPVADLPPPDPQTTPSHRAGPPGGADPGIRARWRGRAPVAIAAGVTAVVLGVLGVWLWPRLNADTAAKRSTASSIPIPSSSPSSSASQFPSPSRTVSSQPLVWQSVPGPRAQGLGGAAVAAHQGGIWVAGGMGTTVRVYDPATGRWRNGPPLPAAESFGTLVSDGKRLYFMGGLSSDGQGLRTVYRLDSPDGSWSQDSPLPQGRFSGAAAWDGHRVVFAGGSANIHLPRPAASDVWALTSGHWARIATLPTPREHLAAATDGSGTVWFVGGANVSVGPTGVYAEVDELRGSHVARAGPLPKPVQGLSAAWTSASSVCAFGGSTTQPNDNSAAVRTVTCLGDRKLPELPRATGLPVSATLGGTVYVVAGPEMFLLPVGA
jgi:hypothetical protein